MIRIPSQLVANRTPFATLDLAVDRALVALLQQLYVGDGLGPVNEEYVTKTAVYDDLDLARDVFCDLPRFAPVKQHGFDS